LAGDVFRDTFDISRLVGRHTIGTRVRAEYESEGRVLWLYMWQFDDYRFLRRKKNVALTTSHDILEFFVMFEIDSRTIIIQNDDTTPH
jgi:hypothetical protein